MPACGEDVVPDEPVARHDLIEPRETRLVRVAGITVCLEDVADFRRRLDLGDGGIRRNARPNELKQQEDDECGKDQPAKNLHAEPPEWFSPVH